MPVHRLGDVGRNMPDELADVLQRHVTRAENRHKRMTQLAESTAPPPAALMIWPSSRRTCQRSSGTAARRRVRRSPRRALRVGAPAQRARAGPALAEPLIFGHSSAPSECSAESAFSLSIVPLPADASKAAARFGVRPTLDPAPARTRFGTCEEGQD